MAKIKEDNYICIQGWMLSKLNLKGNALLVYAIIYGFCQDGHSCFHGSLDYLQQWTNSTRQGVINTLKELLEMKLIRKEEGFPNHKYYLYDSTMYNFEEVNKVSEDVKKVYNDSKNSLHNTIDNKKEVIDSNAEEKYNEQKELRENIEKILKFLNDTCHVNYRSSATGSIRVIKARLKEGYKLEDFYTVIKYKYEEWGRSPTKFSNGQWSNTYLRPSTLFGTKMDEYLQQASMGEAKDKVKSVPKLKERSTKTF